MPYWGSEKIKQEIVNNKILDLRAVDQIECCSVEMRLGNEAFVTSFEQRVKRVYRDGDQITIGPGQFGILLAKDKVCIPKNAMGFISIKAGLKFRGLINVSGFHVDPGFEGYLKFSVYNAGSQDVTLTVGERMFLIWFTDLIDNKKTYRGNHAGMPQITADDVMKIQGQVASPGELARRLDRLEDKVTIGISILVGILIGVVIFFLQQMDMKEQKVETFNNDQTITEKSQ